MFTKKRIFNAIIAGVFLAAMCAFGAAAQDTEAAEQISYELPMAGDAWDAEAELLPVGSVVLLKDSADKIMVMGYLQSLVGEDGEAIYDYAGCLFPEGYIDADGVYVFDHTQIETIYYVGYVDEEEQEFMERVMAVRAEYK